MNSTEEVSEETLQEMERRLGYEPEKFPCPKCRKFTLEYQIFGYTKEVFCTSSSCGYHETIEL